MSIRKIVKVWTESELIDTNISFLKEKTKNVYFPITDNTKKIIQDLIDTYRKIPCAGIAANQIGYDKSIFIGLKKLEEDIDVDDLEEKEATSSDNPEETNEYADNFQIYINPQIDKVDKKSFQEEVEGCLSIPNITLRIKRYNKIKVRYYDQNGRVVKKSLDGFMSKLFQHELDHLNGKLMIEHDLIEGYIDETSSMKPEIFQELREKLR